MEKPSILKEIEMTEDLAGVVNKYSKEIPYKHIATILKELLAQVDVLSEQQIALIKAEWEKQNEPKDEK